MSGPEISQNAQFYPSLDVSTEPPSKRMRLHDVQESPSTPDRLNGEFQVFDVRPTASLVRLNGECRRRRRKPTRAAGGTSQLSRLCLGFLLLGSS